MWLSKPHPFFATNGVINSSSKLATALLESDQPLSIIHIAYSMYYLHSMFHSATLSHAFTQILIIITQADPTRQRDLETALFWGIRLTVVSTAINPFLYGLLARQYRMAYVYVFRLWLSKCCDFCVDPPLKDVFGECIDSPTHPHSLPGQHKKGLYSMYRSLQYIIFTSCNVVLRHSYI